MIGEGGGVRTWVEDGEGRMVVEVWTCEEWRWGSEGDERAPIAGVSEGLETSCGDSLSEYRGRRGRRGGRVGV